MTRTERFLARLRVGEVLVADGATGTMLQNEGLEAGRVPEAWLFDRPDQIRALHRSYIEAGADIILTCSFGGTRYRLEGDGLADRVMEVNRRAAELAREVAAEADGVFVAGDMGPTGQLLKPLGEVTPEEMAAAYAEQAAGLLAGGADFLLIETMSDLGEARAAIEGARRVTRSSGVPIVCTFSFDTHGRTMMGVRPAHAAGEIGPLVEGVGANCGRDPAEFPAFIQAMRQAAPAAILWAKPNAGLPRMVDDRAVYEATPEYMAEIAVQLCDAGAQVIGGCCGTTPAHIVAMAEALNKRPR
jgi:5-methyltetrahydrofolate--homocysteine methyltransferase